MQEEEYLFNKIMNHEALTEDEVKDLIWDYKVEEEEGDSGRWTCPVETIVCLNGHYFSIEWEKGLTEYQDNYYDDFFPVEVKPVERTIQITVWEPVDEEGDNNNESKD